MMNLIVSNARDDRPVEAADAEPVASVYEQIRRDILKGSFAADERLKISNLAARYHSGTNPVREALQQLRGEGFVVFEPNRGARVRRIDESYVRDIFEMEVLIEPYLTGWFVSHCTDDDIERLEAIQSEIEALDFGDRHRHATLDIDFHRLMYDRHYNRHAVNLWWKHREILIAIGALNPMALSRRRAVLEEHRALIAALKNQDERAAVDVISRHVKGAGEHLVSSLAARLRTRAVPLPDP